MPELYMVFFGVVFDLDNQVEIEVVAQEGDLDGFSGEQCAGLA